MLLRASGEGMVILARVSCWRGKSSKAVSHPCFEGVPRACLVNMAVLILALAPLTIRAADYAEITVELSSTWRSNGTTNHHSVTATCVVGSNYWFISGEFLKNAKIDSWLVGDRIAEYQTITSGMYFEHAKEFVSEKVLRQNQTSMPVHSYPHAGQTFTTIHPAPLGQPSFQGMEGVVWLAFCSREYLKQPDRKVPMLIGPSERAFGYADKTLLLDDPYALPKKVELFATNGTRTCEYEVLKATNFLGQTWPMQFRVWQLGQPADGEAITYSKTDLEGRVLSIRAGMPPAYPAEVQKRLGR